MNIKNTIDGMNGEIQIMKSLLIDLVERCDVAERQQYIINQHLERDFAKEFDNLDKLKYINMDCTPTIEANEIIIENTMRNHAELTREEVEAKYSEWLKYENDL